MITAQLNGEPTLDHVHVMRSLSGTWSDRWMSDILLPSIGRRLGMPSADLGGVRDRLTEPDLCFEVLLGEYAFARRGSLSSDFGDIAVEAARRGVGAEPTELWCAFAEGCSARSQRPSESLNRGLLEGLGALSKDLSPCSLASWITEGILSSGRVEAHFMRLTEIRGVGPKVASTLLRDIVWLYDLEDQIEYADRIYLQPVDTWIREFSRLLIPGLDASSMPDWVIAGKFARLARRANISGVRLNCGASYFGSSRIRVPEALMARLPLLDA